MNIVRMGRVAKKYKSDNTNQTLDTANTVGKKIPSKRGRKPLIKYVEKPMEEKNDILSDNESLFDRMTRQQKSKITEGTSLKDITDKKFDKLRKEKEAVAGPSNAEIDYLQEETPFSNSSQNRNKNIKIMLKIKVLKTTINHQEEIIRRLDTQLTNIRIHVQTLETEKKTQNAEINDYKVQLSNLNEENHLIATEKNFNIDEIRAQHKQHEARINKIKQDVQQDLDNRHDKELSAFRIKLDHYEQTTETLKQKLINYTELQNTVESNIGQNIKTKFDELKLEGQNEQHKKSLHFQKEKALLDEQIRSYQLQLEQITSKYNELMKILESGKNIEQSLKEENNSLKIQLHDMSCKYTVAQSAVENRQIYERTLSNRLEDEDFEQSSVQSNTTNAIVRYGGETLYTSYEDQLERYFEQIKVEQQKVFLLDSDLNKVNMKLRDIDSEKTMYKEQLNYMKNMYEESIKEASSSRKFEHLKLEEEIAQHQETKKKLDEKIKKEHALLQEFHNLESKWMEANYKLKEADILKKTHEEQLMDTKNKYKYLAETVDSLKEYRHTTLDAFNEHLKNKISDVEKQVNLKIKHEDSIRKLQRKFELKVEEVQNLKVYYKKKLNRQKEWHENKMYDSKVKRTEHEVNIQALQQKLELKVKEIQNYETMLNEQKEFYDHQICNIEAKKTKYADNIQVLQQEIELKVKEIQNVKTDYKKMLNEQKEFYEDQIRDIEAKKTKYADNTQVLQQEIELKVKEIQNIKADYKKMLNEQKEFYEDQIRDIEAKKTKYADNAQVLQQEIELKVKEIQNTKADNKKMLNEQKEFYEYQIRDIEAKKTKYADNTKVLQQEIELKVKEIQNIKTYYEEMVTKQKERYQCQIHDITAKKSEHEVSIQALQQNLELNVKKIQDVKTNYDKMLEEQKELYECQIHDMKTKLENELNVPISTMHQASSMKTNDENNWSNNLLKLLNEFTSNAKQENQKLEQQDAKLTRLQEQLQELISTKTNNRSVTNQQDVSNVKDSIEEMNRLYNARLKDEVSQMLTQTLEQHHKKVNLFETNMNDTNDVKASENTETSDNLWKTCLRLQRVIKLLVNYIMTCEGVINDILITKILQKQLPISTFFEGKTINKTDNTIKEIHFIPRSDKIVSLINSNSETFLSLIDQDTDELLKIDLRIALTRLKVEANEIFAVLLLNIKEMISSSNKDFFVRKIRKFSELTQNRDKGLMKNDQKKVKPLEESKIETITLDCETITLDCDENDPAKNDISLVSKQEKEELCEQNDGLTDDATKEKEDLQQQNSNKRKASSAWSEGTSSQ
ncbi:PREDICTED: putative leucine-rich repeat-containing protein DDB_G0290503 isoform X2 [Cyphomyrmex costatus]|nr:PREDICTED: putative leucine-rich repeat-containing protein DDB_G0290503 isoform X2 [Cyphomyrmex costatus]